MPPIDSDLLLLKYMSVKMPIERISQKLGITTNEVLTRWRRLQETAQSIQSSQADLAQQLNVMALQYQLLGESLKIVVKAVGNSVTPTELRALITADPEETVRNILKACIVLRAFVPINPVESLQQSQGKN
jgi:hypothetical protein